MPHPAQQVRTGLTFTLSLAASALLLARAAFALVSLNEAQSGSLLLKANTPGQYVEAPKVATDYTTNVTGPIARTILTQQFYNPSDGWVEGVYAFPLPDTAAVDALKIVSGTHVIVGSIKEKQEAKQIYETAKANGQAAALLEQLRPNLFTNSVANIGPHEKVTVQIEYQETVHQSGGTYDLRLPLVVAPRYEPATPIVQSVTVNAKGLGETHSATPGVFPDVPVLNPAVDGVSNPVSITINLNAGFALGDVQSAFHKVDVVDNGPEARTITLAGVVPADRDFELTWKAKGQSPQAGLFKESLNGHDYLLGFVTPPDSNGPALDLPRDITFVIDNSGSMGGTAMPQAKQSLLYGLAQLKPADSFNIIRFDDTMTNVFGHSVPASPGNLKRGADFVNALEAAGGTEMVPPMQAALRDDTPDDKTHLRQVVFITDGEISNEQELFDTIAKHHGRTRVFMVGIGSAPNTYLMTRASALGRGTYTQIGEPKQLNDRMTDLFSKIGHPVITDLKASMDGSTAQITPDQIPDLYRGEPVLLLADAADLHGTLKISGKIGDRPWQVALPIAQAAPGTGIAKLWARSRISDLETAATLQQIKPDEANKAVLALALEHQLVSSQTSLVAVDQNPKRPPGYVLTRADVPLNLPAGWIWEKVFGESTHAAPQDWNKTDDGLLQFTRLDANGLPQPQGDEVPLAQGATDARLMALLALALAAAGLFVLRREKLS